MTKKTEESTPLDSPTDRWDLFGAALRGTFKQEEHRFRLLRSGKKNSGDIWAMCLVYLDARAVMDRLDDTVGAGNWMEEYVAHPTIDKALLCRLSLRLSPDDPWVTKTDGADATDVEATKGQLSDAFKRAGVKWGIGRYLYESGESFANVGSGGQFSGQLKDKTRFRWSPPGDMIPAGKQEDAPSAEQAPAKKSEPPPKEEVKPGDWEPVRDQFRLYFKAMGIKPTPAFAQKFCLNHSGEQWNKTLSAKACSTLIAQLQTDMETGEVGDF